MSLYQLTASCTVRIESKGMHGSGFFAGDGLVVTCAHVTDIDDVDRLQVIWPAGENVSSTPNGVVRVPASNPAGCGYPYPDLALLTVNIRGHPSVRLSERIPRPGDELYAFGYPDDYRNGDSGYYTFEGPTGGPDLLLKLKNAQVRPGMSGAPLLDARNGAVCGVMKISRGTETDIGGRGVPASVILAHFPRLTESQASAENSSSAWLGLRSASTGNGMPDIGTAWSAITAGQRSGHDRIAIPKLDIVRFAVEPVTSWQGPADSDFVDSVRGLVAPVVELDNLFGGQDLARISVRLFRLIQDRIAVGDYVPSVERDLMAAAAEIAEVAGWLCYDANEQRLSRQLNQEALLMTRLSGDRNLELLVLQNMSMQAGFVGRPREALLLAQAATENPLSSRLSTIFHVRQGRAYAQEGFRTEARRAFARARASYLDGVSDRDPSWAWWFEEHEMAWHEAMAAADLGEWTKAGQLFHESIDPHASTSHRDRYVYGSHLLWALAEAGDWRGAGEVLDSLTGFVGEVSSVRVEDLLRKVHRLASGRGTAHRRAFAEQLGNILESRLE